LAIAGLPRCSPLWQVQGVDPKVQFLGVHQFRRRGLQMRNRKRTHGRRSRGSRGQTLVEFSLVILPFLIVITAICEFAFLLTVKVGVTDTAQDAVQLASEMGNQTDTDWYVLQLVEKDMSAPIDKTKIVSVEIFWTDSYGTTNKGEDKYLRNGGTFANQAGATVPYSASTASYPVASRCNINSNVGCVTGHTSGGVDWIGVKITYQYSWVTPLASLIGLGSSAPTFVQSSTSRLEPVQ
jgi:Flp pilus assembly protein TadG